MGLIRLGNKPPLTVGPQDTVAQAARAMTQRGVGAAAVVEGNKVLGVVTERDMLQKVVANEHDATRIRVREIMTSPPLTIHLKTTVDDAATMMRKHHIRHLIVLDDNEALVGMLAQRYVLYDLMDDLKRDAGDLLGYIMADGPGG